MAARGRGDLGAPEHPSEFVDSVISAQQLDLADRVAVLHRFAHPEVLVGRCGYLRQMGHAQHLACAPEVVHEFADHGCDRAANAGIGFVKDQGADRIVLRGQSADGQADTRELAT